MQNKIVNEVTPIIEILQQSKKAISSQELLLKAGYPSDSSTLELEKFFLDIRENLKLQAIKRLRVENEDFFELLSK